MLQPDWCSHAFAHSYCSVFLVILLWLQWHTDPHLSALLSYLLSVEWRQWHLWMILTDQRTVKWLLWTSCSFIIHLLSQSPWGATLHEGEGAVHLMKWLLLFFNLLHAVIEDTANALVIVKEVKWFLQSLLCTGTAPRYCCHCKCQVQCPVQMKNDICKKSFLKKIKEICQTRWREKNDFLHRGKQYCLIVALRVNLLFISLATTQLKMITSCHLAALQTSSRRLTGRFFCSSLINQSPNDFLEQSMHGMTPSETRPLFLQLNHVRKHWLVCALFLKLALKQTQSQTLEAQKLPAKRNVVRSSLCKKIKDVYFFTPTQQHIIRHINDFLGEGNIFVITMSEHDRLQLMHIKGLLKKTKRLL